MISGRPSWNDTLRPEPGAGGVGLNRSGLACGLGDLRAGATCVSLMAIGVPKLDHTSLIMHVDLREIIAEDFRVGVVPLSVRTPTGCPTA